MQFKQLEAFARVAETRSFSRAAEELYLTQPTVSAHLKALEETLDVRLITRSTRSLSLTREGELFLPYAQRILELRNTAVQRLKNRRTQRLSIGASTIPSAYLLPGILKEYRKIHPEVYFNVSQGSSREVEEMLLDGAADIGFTGMLPESPELLSEPLCRDRLMLAAPPTPYYQKLFSGHPDTERLLQEPLILRESSSGTKHALDLYLREHDIDLSRLNVIGNMNDPEAIKQMILSNAGISILSGFSIEDLVSRGQLIALPLETKQPREFYILHKKNREIPPEEKEFLRFSKALLKDS